uniref:Uncharacterized protein n=1 Tax=Rhizophora mucronata TaxID=61149 RepID=A0A2P2PIX0_RHIMU
MRISFSLTLSLVTRLKLPIGQFHFLSLGAILFCGSQFLIKLNFIQLNYLASKGVFSLPDNPCWIEERNFYSAKNVLI